MSIDWYASQSAIRSMHPGVKFGFGLVWMIMVLAVNLWLFSLAAFLLMAVLLVAMAGIPAGALWRSLRAPVVLIGIAVVTVAGSVGIPADDRVQVLWALRSGAPTTLYISRESLMQALALATRGLGAVGALFFIAFSTPLNDLFILLRRFRVPMFLITLMAMIYRFIFLIQDAFQTLIHAQHLRMGYYGLRTGLRSLGTAMGALFVKVFARSAQLEDSLDCRLYSGSLLTLEPVWARADSKAVCLLALGVLAVVLGVFLKTAGGRFSGFLAGMN